MDAEKVIETTFTIAGMTCNNCRVSVEGKLNGAPDISDAKVDLDQGEATILASKILTAADIQALLPEKYSVAEKSVVPEAVFNQMEIPQKTNKWKQLKPLFLILFYITVSSLLLHRDDFSMQAFMLDFMGLFFLVFSFFKMLDLKGFATSFSMYDPLANKIGGYANVYPFIETALALSFLLRIQVEIALVVTIIILGLTTIGVTKSLLSKQSIRCACLGTALNLPMTEATFIENAIMLVMATALLFQLVW